MKLTQKEELVLAISSMDINDIEALLFDSYRYQDASKKVYIKKLSDLFSKYKKFGDSRFIVKDGCCNSKTCHNNGCNGYSFVGNVSKNYFNLLFSETGNNFSEIDYCYDFKIDDLSEVLNDEVRLEVLAHESAWYLDTLCKNEMYLDLISLSKNGIYSIDIIKEWISEQNYDSLGKTSCEPCGLICFCGYEKIEEHLKNLYDELDEFVINVNENKDFANNNLVIHNNTNYYKVFIEELNNLTLLIKI